MKNCIICNKETSKFVINEKYICEKPDKRSETIIYKPEAL